MNAKSGYFLSGDVTSSSPVLYREYCIQDGNLAHALLPIFPGYPVLGTKVNPDTCQMIRVDGQVPFASGYVRTWKFLNPQRKSCGFKISGYVWTGLTFFKLTG